MKLQRALMCLPLLFAGNVLAAADRPSIPDAATTIRRALDNYPRNNDGGFWHSTGMHGQMWIDGIFMGQMFLTRYGKSIGDTPGIESPAAQESTE
jgi:rhamnogalacturonyl hydrolase YesR